MQKSNRTTTMLVVVVAAFAAIGALTALGTSVTGLGSFATPAFASYGDSGGDSGGGSQHDFQGEESGDN
ncbi:MAG: hypothetical protein M3P08_20575 [Thermoproteota archaeon]|nr:hypothetical protein [Thermoproteota archaeon]